MIRDSWGKEWLLTNVFLRKMLNVYDLLCKMIYLYEKVNLFNLMFIKGISWKGYYLKPYQVCWLTF